MFNSGKFAGRTAFITGASRGIGKEIALKLAKDGANIVVAAKTAEAHSKLPGTIYSAAAEIEKAGGKCLPCIVDVRDEQSVQKAVEDAVKKFGGIDILVNNASAISLTGTLDTPMKRYDLMHQINTRGTFLVSQKCIPYLKQSKNAHILNISPPLLMETQWFSRHVAYTMAKYGMSMCVLGMHEELRPDRIAVNALWPRTAIWTSAMEMLAGEGAAAGSRKPSIMADAAYAMLSRDSGNFTGNFCIDDDVLKEAGVTNFDQYAMDPKAPLMPDFFVPGIEYPSSFETKESSTRQKSRKAMEAGGGGGGGGDGGGGIGGIEQTFQALKKLISAELVSKIGAVYEFKLTGANSKTYHVDLKNGSGAAGEGAPKDKADVTFSMDSEDFVKMFKRELKATQAFMSGKLKIKGDMGKAMKLEGLMGQMGKSKL